MRDDNLSVEICKPILEDAQQILEWRNNPHTLSMFFHREVKTLDKFFDEYKKEYFKTEPWPLFVIEGGKRVAFLRFNKINHPEGKNRSCCDISINVDPELRGRHLGSRSLILASQVLKDYGVDDIIAEIRVENTSSIKAFEKAGYKFIKQLTKHIKDTGEHCKIVLYIKRLEGR